jgi:hypothetical protein
MIASVLAAEVTGAIREFGADIDTHGRALGTSVRNLVAPAGVGRPSRLGSAGASTGPGTVDASSDWVIVDKSLTRC